MRRLSTRAYTRLIFGRLLLCTIALCLCPTVQILARSGDIQYGLGVGAGQVTHSADFNNLPGVPKADAVFGDTTEIQFSLFTFVELPLNTPFHAGLRLEYQHYSPQFLAFEPTVVLSNDAPLNTMFRHELTTSLDAIALEPYLAWREPYWPWLTLGAHFSLFAAGTYEQQQGLPAGTDLVFEFPEKSGDVPELNMQMAVHLGVGYDIPIGGADAVIRPSVDAVLGLNNLVSDTEWKTWSIRGGVALAFGARPDKYIRRDTVIQRDTAMSLTFGIEAERMTLRERKIEETSVEGETERYILTKIHENWLQEIPAPMPLLTGNVRAVFIDDNGSETETLTLDLEPTRVERLIQVPQFYSPRPKSQREEAFRKVNPLYGCYADLPLTIGAPESDVNSISIGYFSQGEKGASSELRALRFAALTNSVKNSQLEVNTKPGSGLPEEVVPPLELDIQFADGKHFVRSLDTIALGSTPVVRFLPDIISEAGVTSWALSLRYNGIKVDSLGGEGMPPERLEVPIKFAYDLGILIEHPTVYEFTVSDSSGGSQVISSGTLRFREGEDSSPIVNSRKELVLFDSGLNSGSAAYKQAVDLLTSGGNTFKILESPRRRNQADEVFNKSDMLRRLSEHPGSMSSVSPFNGILILSLPD